MKYNHLTYCLLYSLGFTRRKLGSRASAISATSLATPQLISYPRPPAPYACRTWPVRSWPSIPVSCFSSACILMPPSLVGRRPTTSVMTPIFSGICVPASTEYDSSFCPPSSRRCRVAGLGSVCQFPGSFVPPTMVPPLKKRGIVKLHVPSLFCLVTVFVTSCRSVITVWPWRQRVRYIKSR